MSFGLGGSAQGNVRYAVLLDDTDFIQKLTEVKTTLTQLVQPTQQLGQSLATLGTSFTTLGGTMGTLGTDMQAVLTAMEGLTVPVTETGTGMTELATSTTELTAGMEGLATPIESLDDPLTTLVTDFDALKTNMAEQIGQIDEFGSGVSAITAPIQEVDSGVKELVGDLGPLGNNFRDTAGAAQDMIVNQDNLANSTEKLSGQTKLGIKDFTTFAAGMTATVSSGVGLIRSFQRIGDAQLKVDKSTRGLSVAQEALEKAQRKQAEALAESGKNSQAYADATRDVQQATQKVDIAVKTNEKNIRGLNQSWIDAGINAVTTGASFATTFSGLKDAGEVIKRTGGGIKDAFKGIPGLFTSAGTGAAAMGKGFAAANLSGTALIGTLAGIASGVIGAALVLDFAMKAQAQWDKLSNTDVSKRKSPIAQWLEGDKEAIAQYKGQLVEMENAMKIAGITGFDMLSDWATGSTIVADKLAKAGIVVKETGKLTKETSAIISAADQQVIKSKDALIAAEAEYQAALATGTKRDDAAAKAKRDKAAAEYESAKANAESAKATDTATTATHAQGEAVKETAGGIAFYDETTKAFTATAEDLSTKMKPLIFQTETAADKFLKTSGIWAQMIPQTQGLTGSMLELAKSKQTDTEVTEKQTAATLGLNGAMAEIFETMRKRREQTAALNKSFAAIDPTGGLSVKNLALGGVFTTNAVGILQQEKAQRALQAVMLKDQEVVTNEVKAYVALQRSLSGVFDTTGKTMAELLDLQGVQDEVTKSIKGFALDQETGFKLVETSILGVAYAHDVNTAAMEAMVLNGKNEIAVLREMVGSAIDVTKGITDMALNQELVSEGFMSGVIQAEEFFNSLVKGTEQEYTFNAALAEGAEALGIQADLWAFSSGKMQELIATTYEMTTVNKDLAIAAATSTEWLHDQAIIIPVVQKAMLEGAQSANDWTISMIAQEQAAKDNHGQLVALATEMTGLNNLQSLTSEQLQQLMTDFINTGDSVASLANAVRQDLEPAFARLSSVLDAKTFKEMKENFKELELGDISGKLQDRALKLMKPIQEIREAARQTGDIFSVLITVGDEMTSKDYSKWVGELADNMEDMAGADGGGKAFDDIITAVRKMPPEELDKHAKSIEFLTEAAKSGKGVDSGEWDKFFSMWNSEVPKAGSAASSAAPNILKLGESFKTVFKSLPTAQQVSVALNPFSLATGQNLKPQTQQVNVQKTETTKLLMDNSDAIAKVNQVKDAVHDIAEVAPVLQVVTDTAVAKMLEAGGRWLELEGVLPAMDINPQPALNRVADTGARWAELESIVPEMDLGNQPALNTVADTGARWAQLDDIVPDMDLGNQPALNTVADTGKAWDQLQDIVPEMELNNQPALDIVADTGKAWDQLKDVVPDMELNNEPALDQVAEVDDAISDLADNNPKIDVDNTPAIKKIDQIARRISDLPDGEVTVHVGLSGPGVHLLAEGMHGVVTKPTLFLAGEEGAERIDVTPIAGSPGESGMTYERAVSVKPTGTLFQGGTNAGVNNNVIFESHVHLFDSEMIMRKMVSKQGTNRFRYGA